ncbi:LamG domain-containing protein [Kitasatospora sp. NPDC004240]
MPQPQPQQPWQQATLPSPPAGTPDWEALANRNEADAKKKRRMRMIIAVATVVVLAGGTAAGLVLLKDNSGTPSANGSPTASASGGATGSPKSPAPTASGTPKSIPGPATVGSIPAAKGTVALGLGSDAKQGTMPGYPGQVLKLPSGQNSFAQSADQVVDTDKSFTVSARVFVDVPTGNRSAVSQGDGPYYSYSLGRAAAPDGRNLWYFKVQLPGGGSAVAWSKGEAPVNQWALLTGVYDAAAGQITLYINGAAQSAEKAAGVKASGADTLQIGRLSSNSQWSDPWHGAVADIQTWSQVLPEADIVKIVAGPSSPPSLPPAAAWLTG